MSACRTRSAASTDRAVPRAELRGQRRRAWRRGRRERRNRQGGRTAPFQATQPRPRREKTVDRADADGPLERHRVAGIGIAAYFWLRNRRAADAMTRASPASTTAAEQVLRRRVVQRGHRPANQAALDRRAVEGRRRGAGRRRGERRRAHGRGPAAASAALQTGSVRAYAASLFFGVVLILGWYLWR